MDLLSSCPYDLVAFSEFSVDVATLLRSLSARGISYYPINLLGCERIHLFTRFNPDGIHVLREYSYHAILKVQHETLGYHIVAIVHLPSKRYADEDDLVSEARFLKDEIEEIEMDHNTSQTVVFGDFNMNPFDAGMVNADSLFTVPCRKVASKISRTVRGQVYSMFYNPMWNMFGDIQTPPGTFYYAPTKLKSYYWHILDQVILRPSLINRFPVEKLQILRTINGISLTNNAGCPKQSDHFPICFEIV